MSTSYLENKEVFFAMKKLFDQLYKGEPKFKQVFDSFGKVTLEVDDSENLVYLLNEVGETICLGVYDWNIGDNFPVSMKFTEVFLYEKESAYLYSGGVVADEDRAEEGFNYYPIEACFDYPEMDEVLVREGHSNEWKKIKGVPSVFKEILKTLEVSIYDDVNIVKIYNQNKDLVVDVIGERYGVLDRGIYGDNPSLDSNIEDVIKVIYDLKVPISEIFIFSSGDMVCARLRKNKTGEYTLVLE